MEFATQDCESLLWLIAGVLWVACICSSDERRAAIYLVVGFMFWAIGFIIGL